MQTGLWFDLKYAVRLLRKTMTHSLLTVLVVALSLGLSLFVFVMNYAIAFRPLPFEGSSEWLSVQVAQKKVDRVRPRVDEYTYQEIVKRSSDLDHLGAFGGREAVLSEGEESHTLRAAVISPRLLEAIQVKPQLGRIFGSTDGQTASAPAAILSHETWKAYFGADPSVIGKSVRIDAQPYRVVGVMPEGFFAFQDFEVWFPYSPASLVSPADSRIELAPFVRLGKGQTADDLRSEIARIVSDLNGDHPRVYGSERHSDVIPAYRIYSHANMPVIIVSSIIALAILILGSINIGMIFYARMLERSRELALRAALGASRGRLVRQCLLESVVIVAIGFAVGIGFAIVGVEWGQSIREFPARILASGMSMDYPQLRALDIVVALSMAGLLWLASTLLPAWYVLKQDPAKVIAGSGKGSSGQRRSRLATLLVATQVLISSALLFICISLVVAVTDEVSKERGILVDGLYATTEPTEFTTAYEQPVQRINYWRELSSSIASNIPGSVAAFSTSIPSRPPEMNFQVEDQDASDSSSAKQIPVTDVDDNYFSMLGIGLKSGRIFDATDTETSTPVAVIDEITAKRYWPNQDPAGKRIRIGSSDDAQWLTIIGVVSHVAGRPYSGDPGLVYRSIRQTAPSSFYTLVKTPAASATTPRQIRVSAFEVDRDLPMHNVQRLDDLFQALEIGFASTVRVFSVIVGITILLAASGLFGLISRSVVQRTQEIGIRRALGSSRQRIMRLFLKQSFVYLAIAFVGAGLGIAATNLMSGAIPNALAAVGMVIVLVVLVLFAVVFSASYFPSRRAVNLEPSEALRYE
jgi:predicted permease